MKVWAFHLPNLLALRHRYLRWERLFYYAVDHSPSYLWNAATPGKYRIAWLLICPMIMGGPESWEKSETIRRAIEIKDGVIQNPKITTFQNRSNEYPHPELAKVT